MTLLLVAVGGGVGAGLRHWAGGGRTPRRTLGVNLLGSLLAGLLAGATLSRELDLLLVVGFCGGFTTYSTWALEATATRARAVAIATPLGCVALAWLGLQLGGIV